ncbi:MAG TPA: sigma-70 family RNA polymerase sigma factor [Candidatus Eisenbacteria bacterium]|nr:sigma-70 family RNA polymerase sigma factor [Candidatus Eisenbacteria bacterium]
MDSDLAVRLERAKAGDGHAFDELLAPVLDPAFRLAMTMLKDRGAAEDAVQEAALKAWRALGRFRTGAELRPWFLAIVANECRSARRGRWWRVLRFGDAGQLGGAVASDRSWAERIDLGAALDRLPRHHLLALTLYYHLDLPMDEVARVLGCSSGGARQRVHRALAALRPAMAVEVDA